MEYLLHFVIIFISFVSYLINSFYFTLTSLSTDIYLLLLFLFLTEKNLLCGEIRARKHVSANRALPPTDGPPTVLLHSAFAQVSPLKCVCVVCNIYVKSQLTLYRPQPIQTEMVTLQAACCRLK